MADRYETRILVDYLCNILSSKKITWKIFQRICEWLETNAHELISSRDEKRFYCALESGISFEDRASGKFRVMADMRDRLLPILEKARKRLSPTPSNALQKNLEILALELRLDELDTSILGLVLNYSSLPEVETLCDAVSRDYPGGEEILSLFLNIPRQTLSERLSSSSPLVTSGALVLKYRINRHLSDFLEIPDVVLEGLQKGEGTLEDIRERIIGKAGTPDLQWADFNHLGSSRDVLADFLAGALRESQPGINVLIYGPPGTGKTEFCKTLAGHLGLPLYSVGESNTEGEELNRQGRIGAFRVAQTLLRHQKGSLLLVDEMDDLFSEEPDHRGRKITGSKVFCNRLLETNRIPTLWTINNVNLLEDSLIRRMSFAFEMKVPPRPAREKIWLRILDRQGMEVPCTDIPALASLEDVAPAVAENAVRFARLAGGTAEEIHLAASNIVKAMKGDCRRPQMVKDVMFRPELVHADADLHQLEKTVVDRRIRNFSLCLYGPSGTGKSAFARHLAGKLGMNVLLKHASEILGMFVGETEKKIAAAFEQARDEDAFLIFDEADSFLQDRRGAHRSWEITQVNEMLTWMEDHPLPFACTTNLMNKLDQASLRRFTFKSRFDFLRPDQVEKAFTLFFGQDPVPALSSLRHLTPGDFAVVRKKAEVLRLLEDPPALTDLLAQEMQVKEMAPRPLGFVCK